MDREFVTGPAFDDEGPDERLDERLGEAAARYRGELHVYCYRMLASFDEADDAVGETLLRAEKISDRVSELRTALYRLATGVCLELVQQNGRDAMRMRSLADIAWLQPYPDALLDEFAADANVATGRETMSLGFVAALQSVSPRQRAAFIARETLGWTTEDAGAMLETSAKAANSALERARATMNERLPSWRSEDTTDDALSEERSVLERYINAHERGDAVAAIALAGQDIKVTMPPRPLLYTGVQAVLPLLQMTYDTGQFGEWRLVPSSANRMPTVAGYVRRPDDDEFRAFKLDVLRVEGGEIAEITTFGPALFPAFGLPAAI